MIVGVVRDAQHTTVRDPAMPTAYLPFVQGEKPELPLLYTYLATARCGSGQHPRGHSDIDRKLIVHDLTTLSTQIDDTIANERTIALLASTFGVLATILAGIGLYGILAYSTAQRTREIGIRMALGAQRWEVVRLILREVLALAGVAVIVAIPVAIFATRALRSQLFNVSR